MYRDRREISFLYYKTYIMINKILCCDFRELFKLIPDNSVDCILTDPPYMISREAKIARSRNPLKRRIKFKGKDISFMFGEWDMFESEEEYWKFIYKFLNEAKRTLRKGGHLLVFFDKFKITPLVEWCRKNNFIPRQPLYWIKSNPVPRAMKTNFMNAHEFIFWATKETTSRKYATFNYQYGQHPDYVVTPIVPSTKRRERHPCEKHTKVIEWLLRYLTNEGDLVVDPFCGSGVVPFMCKVLDRNYLACDKDEKWVRIAKERLGTINKLKNWF